MTKPPIKRGRGTEPGLTSAQVAATTSEREPYAFNDPAMEVRALEAIDLSDAELAANDAKKPTVNFRWESGPLEIVRIAAELAGVPYQTWMKQVLYERAVQSIVAAQNADPRARKVQL